MVARLLGLTEVPEPPDAADALALALCHSWRRVAAAVAAAPAARRGRDAQPSGASYEPTARRGRRCATGGRVVIGSVRGTVLERHADRRGARRGRRRRLPRARAARRARRSSSPATPAFLFTHLHVREDAMVLYGFPTRDERDTFEVLIGATGVGPKLGARDPLGALAERRCGARCSTTTSTRSRSSRASASAPRSASSSSSRPGSTSPTFDLAEPAATPRPRGRGARRAHRARLRTRRGARGARPAPRRRRGRGPAARGAQAPGVVRPMGTADDREELLIAGAPTRWSRPRRRRSGRGGSTSSSASRG